MEVLQITETEKSLDRNEMNQVKGGDDVTSKTNSDNGIDFDDSVTFP